VAEIYSPDLVTAQQEYLLALKSREQFKHSPISSISQGGEGLVASSRQRLKLLGVTDEQIAGLERAGQPTIRLAVSTPLSGVVIEKLVQEGQYVNVGDALFNIADLSTVWVEVEVYENEFPLIKLGQQVEISSQSYPGRTFTGRIAFIYPFLDPKTRTVKVRVVIPNQGLKLKPDMYVTARIKVPLGTAVVVPATALIDTGSRQVVWVESSPGMFEPREVKIGERTGDQVQLLSGLKPGEKVAVSGGYLIDSEAQLKGGGGGHENMPGMKMDEKKPATPAQEGHEGHGAPPATPAPAGKGKLNMDDMKM
jgi:membrane fusion protein, copper/silver efflux system